MLAATAHGFRRRRLLGAIQTAPLPADHPVLSPGGSIEQPPLSTGGGLWQPPPPRGGGTRVPPTKWTKSMAAQGYFFTQAVGPTACSAPNQAGGGAGGPADAFGMLAPTTGAICTPSGGTPPPQPQTPADVAVDVTGGGAGTGANVDTGGGSRGGGGVGIDDSYGGGGGGGGITPTTKKPWWPWAVGAAVVAAVGAYVVKAY